MCKRFLNPIQDGHFRGCSRMAFLVPLPKICQSYPTMIKLGSYILPKEDPKKHMNHVRHPRVLLTSAFFYQKSENFVISRNADIDGISIHNF